MGENIYRIFDGVWNLSLVGGYCVLLVLLASCLLYTSDAADEL